MSALKQPAALGFFSVSYDRMFNELLERAEDNDKTIRVLQDTIQEQDKLICALRCTKRKKCHDC